MTDPYSVGTVTVANGGTTVTGTGTFWVGKVRKNDMFFDPAQGLFARVTADPTDNEELAITAWAGTGLTDAAYEIIPAADSTSNTARLRELLAQMTVIEANGRGLFYLFDDTVTDADPGAGNIRLNNSDPSLATEIYIDNVDANGSVVADEIDQWGATVAPVRSWVWIRSISDRTAFCSFSVVAAVVDGTGYRKLVVSPVNVSGSFSAADELMISVIPNGSQGAGFEYSAEVADMASLTPYESEDPGYRVFVFDLGGASANRSGVVELNDIGGWDIVAVYTGEQGEQGDQGDKGWAPSFTVEDDGERRVVRLVDYVGGAGTKPTTDVGKYVGPLGMVTDPADASDIRGATGDIDGVTSFWVGRITVDTTPAAARTGLGIAFSSQVQAEAGTDNTTYMTPQRTAQAIAALVPEGKDYDLEISQIALKLAAMDGEAWAFGGGSNGNGFADDLTSLDQIDVAGATNLSTAEAGVLKPTTAAESAISQATGTNIGNMTASGGLAAAFDGSTNTFADRGATSPGYVGKDYSSGPKKISKVVATSHNSAAGFDGTSSASNITITLYGKNGSAPSSGTDGASLGTTGSFADGAGPVGKTITSSDQSTLWDYVWVYITSSVAEPRVANVVFYEPGEINDMTVASEAFAADAPPTELRFLALVEEVSAATVGDDYVFEGTRDGLDWAIISMDNIVLDLPSGFKLLWGIADVSGLDSGSVPAFRLSTTAVMVKLHDYVFNWRS